MNEYSYIFYIIIGYLIFRITYVKEHAKYSPIYTQRMLGILLLFMGISNLLYFREGTIFTYRQIILYIIIFLALIGLYLDLRLAKKKQRLAKEAKSKNIISTITWDMWLFIIASTALHKYI